jgi:hypothetical protein
VKPAALHVTENDVPGADPLQSHRPQRYAHHGTDREEQHGP